MIRDVGTEPCSFHSLVANFHLRPFAPDFRKVFDGLEVNFGGLLEYLSRAFQVSLCFTFDATFLVKFGEVYVEPVKICRGFSRADRG
jgi:hypothetical protein